MLLSLAWMIVFGMIGYGIFKVLKLPGLLGMLLAGIALGPEGLNLIDQTVLAISGDLRTVALIVILYRAGLGLNKAALKETGKTAGLLSVVPVVLEGVVVLALAVWLLGFGWAEAGVLGFVIAAVSPAIIVPSMLELMRKGRGMRRKVPVLVLAAASVDDVVAITLVSVFLGAALGRTQIGWYSVLTVPMSMVLGIAMGLLVGLLLLALFRRFRQRDSRKVITLLAAGILLVSFGEYVESVVMIAPLLSVMVIGVVMVERHPALGVRLAAKLDKVWVFTELVLFVLVGAALDLRVLLDVGLIGSLIVFAGLTARFVAVWLATLGSGLQSKERLFIGVAFMPKATVQAAVGALPLSLGMARGDTVLALSVLAIVITAPLGAIGIAKLHPWLLDIASPPEETV
ncbi:MAG: sodium:proton antiporter [Acholeplasmatales bacterium]|nr:MAG: sodium:proton antiporter [Acholeplasmatales bacterium]